MRRTGCISGPPLVGMAAADVARRFRRAGGARRPALGGEAQEFGFKAFGGLGIDLHGGLVEAGGRSVNHTIGGGTSSPLPISTADRASEPNWRLEMTISAATVAMTNTHGPRNQPR